MSKEPGFNQYLQIQFLCENAFNPEECKKIIEYSGTIPKTQAFMGNGQIDYTKRIAKTTFIPFTQDNSWISNRIISIAMNANDNFYKFRISHLSDLQVLEYSENGHFDWHVDIGATRESCTRKISIIVFLTQRKNYQGGQLVWLPPAEFTIEQEQGSMVVFPSYHVHKVEPVISGVRHTLLAWLHGEPFS